jgi:hypothetical protein
VDIPDEAAILHGGHIITLWQNRNIPNVCLTHDRGWIIISTIVDAENTDQQVLVDVSDVIRKFGDTQPTEQQADDFAVEMRHTL